MNTSEIENLSAAALKQRKAELAAAAAELPPADLAARYIQARLDAKLRDEKLSEQAATIESLNSGNSALRRGLEESQAAVSQLSKEVARLTESLLDSEELIRNCESGYQQHIAAIEKRSADAEQRAARIKELATKNQHAITAAAKLLNDAIAAQHIETADEVE